MILHIPHASTAIPAELREDFCLSDAELRQELVVMTDWFTDEIFMPAMRSGDRAVCFPVSRLVVDAERLVDEGAEPMAARGMGAVYTRTHDGRPLRAERTRHGRARLIAKFYDPHHRRLAEAVEAELAERGRAVVIDCHSFPSDPRLYGLDRAADLPDICIGTDDFHSPAWLADMVGAAFRELGFSAALNVPFSGALVPMAHYRRVTEVSAIMIEISRRTYLDEAAVEKTEGFALICEAVVKALGEVRKGL